jgi:hypothetical protein
MTRKAWRKVDARLFIEKNGIFSKSRDGVCLGLSQKTLFEFFTATCGGKKTRITPPVLYGRPKSLLFGRPQTHTFPP